MAGSTIPNAPSGENTTPDGSEKIPISGNKFIQILNLISRKVRETGGPTTLLMGAVIDGEYLKRSGSTIISGAVTGLYLPISGWITGTGTWSYTSADSPTFVASVPDADAAQLGVGWRLSLTQTTEKFFIVTAKGSPSGGFTPVTMYGGTDYTLANAAITSPKYSPIKVPFGFPIQREKWTVLTSSTTSYIKTTPTTDTWYGQANVMDSSLTLPSISVPIGNWKIGWQFLFYGVASGAMAVEFTLSTGTSTESDKELSNEIAIGVSPSYLYNPGKRDKNITVASKTPYYALIRSLTSVTSVGIDSTVTNILRAECGYL